MIKKIISGGQSGVDLAALDVAIKLGIAYGGWCPKGRMNENGVIPEKYQWLTEIDGEFKDDQENYAARTRKNIKDSDGTLLLVPEQPLPSTIQDGTLLTMQEVNRQNKPYITIDLSQSSAENTNTILDWVSRHGIKILNVAGPRESTCPGIYQLSLQLLKEVLRNEREL